MKFNKLAALGLFVVGASMAVAIGAHADEATVTQGNWGSIAGSLPVNMRVQASGVVMQFGCGSVTIEGAIGLDANGMFQVTGNRGSYLPSTIKGHPVIVSGKVTGDTMQVTVTEAVENADASVTVSSESYTVKSGTVATFFTCA